MNPRDKLGHYSMWGFPAAAAVSGAVTLAGIESRLVVYPVIAVTLGLSVAYLMLHPGLCEMCAARTPLDGAAKAAQRRRLLKAYHAVTTKGYLTYVLGAAVALAVVAHVFGLKESYVMNVAYVLAFTVPMLAVNLVGLMHSRLMPWCPFCRWGRGGDGPEEIVPDPDPAQWKPSPA